MSTRSSVLDVSSPQEVEHYLIRLGSRLSLIEELLDNDWAHLGEASDEFANTRREMLEATIHEAKAELDTFSRSLLDALRVKGGAR